LAKTSRRIILTYLNRRQGLPFDEVAPRLRSLDSGVFGTGASEDEIHTAETALDVRISGEYRRFLTEFGWGGFGDVEIYGLGQGVPSFLNLVDNALSERNEAMPPLPNHLLPLRNDGGGNLYCLDTADEWRAEPPMVLWNHEAGPGQIPEPIAGGFLGWLTGLLDHLDSSGLTND
jgi:hypothetical protein